MEVDINRIKDEFKRKIESIIMRGRDVEMDCQTGKGT